MSISLSDIKKDYEKAVSYIQSIPRFTEKKSEDANESISVEERFKLVSDFYKYLYGKLTEGDMTLASYSPKVFHVAGTNGKGSVCAYLASMHKAMGKRVGVFTSPHLVDIRERIVCDGEMITKEDFVKCHNIVLKELTCYNTGYADASACVGEVYSGRPHISYKPVYFDHLFFMAVVYYMMKRPDCIIWEVGLGGRYDATNLISYKSVAVITSIGLDHTEILGDTIEKIACEKAGIIKEGVPVVTVDKDKEAVDVIRGQAKALHAPLTIVPDYRHIRKKLSDKGIDFSYESHYYNNATLEIVGSGVRAPYQTENASLAVAAMECVYGREELSYSMIREGLKDMSWPGRMERIEEGVFFDGAHNISGIEAFLDSVRTDGCTGKRLLLFSAVADKQAESELENILKTHLFTVIGLTRLSSDRTIDEGRILGLADITREADTEALVYDNVYEAYDELKKIRRDDDMLYVCGSLYLVGELKAYVTQRG